MSEDLVLVSGASGFIATHLVQQLLRAGYKVRGTVRSLKNEEKTKPLRELCPDAKHPLELVEADLSDEDCWKAVVKDCTYVLHTASPFPNANPKKDDEVIRPAVDGALSVLKASAASGTVKRVVMTSSIAAVSGGFEVGGSYSEENWTDTSMNLTTYVRSKALAEKAAWEYVKELPEEQKFEFAVVNPAYVIGPVLCGAFTTAMEIPKRLLEHKMPALPNINFSVVDVREVAAAHIKAMTIPEAAENRHIVAGENVWLKDIADILQAEFGPMGYKVPTRVAPYFLVKLMAFFDKSVQLVVSSWGKVTTLNTDRMSQVLEIEARPGKESILEMAYSMIDKGFIKKTDKYKLAHPEQSKAEQ